MNSFLTALKQRVLVLDGAMGTMLQERGLAPGASPEAMNLESPEVVTAVHKAYAEAGADIIVTNTFGGNRVKLSHYQLETTMSGRLMPFFGHDRRLRFRHCTSALCGQFRLLILALLLAAGVTPSRLSSG